MGYTIDRTFLETDFATIVDRTKSALASKGFGILTEIDVKATMKTKIDADMDSYLILGACNPNMAYRAIGMEPNVGAMLPCNVIVRELKEGLVQVSAIDPVASMQAIENENLKDVAAQVRDILKNVVDEI